MNGWTGFLSNPLRNRYCKILYGFSFVKPSDILCSDVTNPALKISSRMYDSRAAAMSIISLRSVVEDAFLTTSNIWRASLRISRANPIWYLVSRSFKCIKAWLKPSANAYILLPYDSFSKGLYMKQTDTFPSHAWLLGWFGVFISPKCFRSDLCGSVYRTSHVKSVMSDPCERSTNELKCPKEASEEMRCGFFTYNYCPIEKS